MLNVIVVVLKSGVAGSLRSCVGALYSGPFRVERNIPNCCVGVDELVTCRTCICIVYMRSSVVAVY